MWYCLHIAPSWAALGLFSTLCHGKNKKLYFGLIKPENLFPHVRRHGFPTFGKPQMEFNMPPAPPLLLPIMTFVSPFFHKTLLCKVQVDLWKSFCHPSCGCLQLCPSCPGFWAPLITDSLMFCNSAKTLLYTCSDTEQVTVARRNSSKVYCPFIYIQRWNESTFLQMPGATYRTQSFSKVNMYNINIKGQTWSSHMQTFKTVQRNND